MGLRKLSLKQRKALFWWGMQKFRDRDGIICDGAVRSGKTLSMTLGFFLFAMTNFSHQDFALCGKTITSLRRNVVIPNLPLLKSMGMEYRELVSKGQLEVRFCSHINRFHYFGGKDESSASLIQGMTLAGVFFDEVALMPKSFVEQAIARCSISGSKLWFNCNPEYPRHWFHQEWILKAEEKNMLHLHFTMRDNPSLKPEIRSRYERLYEGAFYDRFVLGKWVAVAGSVYPMFSEQTHVVEQLPSDFERYVASCDYGTRNPTSIGLWGLHQGVWYRIREYYTIFAGNLSASFTNHLE